MNRRMISSLEASVMLAVLVVAGCSSVPYAPTIVPEEFSAVIDNRFLPLVPGTTLVYESTTAEGIERDEVVVTHEKRVVMGVTCVVVRDTVKVNGEITEATDDWLAQDKEGNVWYFGEDSKEYMNGKMTSTFGSWEGGVDGAKPGIVMKSIPVVGDSYRQEFYAGAAEDMAKIDGMGLKISVPFGSYAGVLRTLEWTPLELGVAEYKYYAPDVGVVMETTQGSGERSELIDISSE